MNTFQAGEFIIEYDREATARTYRLIERSDADRCGCSYCRNFVSQRPSHYPPSFLNLLNDLGIDPSKEGEVFECGLEGGLHYYGGWLFLSGKLLQRGGHVRDGKNFEYWFDDGYRPPSEADFGEDQIVLEFSTRFPWVLDEDL
ncbi:MAG TPA: hypothetical protein VGJ21_04685 [Terracidiphilus sp.]|jgi:hypothetical protein